jgi:predicted amidohydrolase YtcJ
MMPVMLAATLVLTNGKIWTGDPAHRFVQAVAIEGNRIVAAGTNEEAASRAGARATVVLRAV